MNTNSSTAPAQARATDGADVSARDQLISTMQVEERRLHLAGVATAVLEGGAGKPLVLLHGPGGYAAHFLRVVPRLVTTHQVIVPDLPGHGASQVQNGNLSAEHVMEWLGELIERTCTSKPVLIGQLLGGAMAARFAIGHGDRISGLVLANSFGLRPFQLPPDFERAFQSFLAQPTDATHDGLWRHCAGDLDTLRMQMGELWTPFATYNVALAHKPSVQAALGALMQGIGMPEIAPAELERIKVPVALIWGRNDRATPLAVAEAASSRLGWPLRIIENANDDPPVEQPEAFVQALRLVLADFQFRQKG